jgi:hypothetical protein
MDYDFTKHGNLFSYIKKETHVAGSPIKYTLQQKEESFKKKNKK